MPISADPKHIELIIEKCLDYYDSGLKAGAMDICTRLMALEDIPMHSPDHHFLLPAAMLTAAHISEGSARSKLISDLGKAKERSKDIPGGICGLNGCCGAGIAAGIFTSIWLGATPLSKESWATANRMTAAALASISSVDGPRCCKRDCYLALQGLIPVIKELTEVDLGRTSTYCGFYNRSRECKKELCPFYHGQ